MPLPLIGAAIGVAGAIGKMFGRGKANREMKRLLAKDPKYVENPLARQRMGLASTLLNARAPGSIIAERNIYANQANQMSNINRSATSSNEALLGGMATQGSTNEAFDRLSEREDMDYQRRYGNLENAQEGVIREGDKVFNDNVRRFGNEAQIKGQINANNQNTWGDVSNLGFGLADFGMNGGFNMFNKKTKVSPYDYSGGGTGGYGSV